MSHPKKMPIPRPREVYFPIPNLPPRHSHTLAKSKSGILFLSLSCSSLCSSYKKKVFTGWPSCENSGLQIDNALIVFILRSLLQFPGCGHDADSRIVDLPAKMLKHGLQTFAPNLTDGLLHLLLHVAWDPGINI